jgi:hypothetical protein
MFHVRQQVVCIQDNWVHPHCPSVVCPKKDRVYTVRENAMLPWSVIPYCIRLFEIINTPTQFCDGFAEAAFDAAYFRPLEKADLAEAKQEHEPA